MPNRYRSPKNVTETRDESAIPILRSIYFLFVKPSILLVLQNHRVTPTLTLVTAISIVAGILISLGDIISIKKSKSVWENWLQEEIQEFGIKEDGSIYCAKPNHLPYSKTILDWLVQITKEDTNDIENVKLGPGKKGFWVGTNSFFLWYRFKSEKSFSGISEDKVQRLDLTAPAKQILTNRSRSIVTTNEIPDLIQTINNTISSILTIYNVVRVLFFALFFSVCSAFMSSKVDNFQLEPNDRSSFSTIFVLNLYCTIPPLLVATIYGGLKLPGVGFSFVFFWTFLCYHFYLLYLYRTQNRADTL